MHCNGPLKFGTLGKWPLFPWLCQKPALMYVCCPLKVCLILTCNEH